LVKVTIDILMLLCVEKHSVFTIKCDGHMFLLMPLFCWRSCFLFLVGEFSLFFFRFVLLFLVVLGFELTASHSLGRCSTTWAAPLA
jgi:hypothetical protein